MAANEPVVEETMDAYDQKMTPWAQVRAQLEAGVPQSGITHWLATTRPDGRPHVAPVGALWIDDAFHFQTGASTRKGLNLAANRRCVISVALPNLDLVVEGTATKVTDEAKLQRVAEAYAAQGWPATARDGKLYADYSAPSAGPPPWDAYEVTPIVAFGVGTAEPYGATRWRF